MSLITIDPKKREKLMLIACAAIFLVASIPVSMYLFGSSVTNMQNQLETAQENIENLENKQKAGKEAEKKILEDAKRSLPSDEAIAVAGYKNWLTEIITSLRFEGGQVTHTGTKAVKARAVRGQTNKELSDYYKNCQFTVKGKTTLNDFGRFLERFYETDTLHLIRSMTVKPIESARRIEVTINIEVVSIPQTTNKIFSAAKKEKDEMDWSGMVRTVASRAFFSPYFPPQPSRTDSPPPQQPRLADATKHTYLNGITWSNDKPQAWFNYRLEGRQSIVKIGDRFRIGPTNCELYSCTDKDVELLIDAIEDGKRIRSIWAMQPGDAFYDAEHMRDLEDEKENNTENDAAESFDDKKVEESSSDENHRIAHRDIE
ncbi:MAG: hypothetical protein LBJ67_05535 [Planctomycetaceae bacterium]|jgi:hypothetical protein|nr:hypothetical protein [Planctomycetaceae bacterium]